MQIKNPKLRIEIIEASRRCFFKYGYKNTSIDTIAKEAHTTASNLYTYFSGKQEIFNEVIGDIPFLIDEYISEEYRENIKKSNISSMNINLDEIFPPIPEIFNEKVSMTLWILLEKSAGTQYAQYKEGLYNVIQDCTQSCLGKKADSTLVKVLSYGCIHKILSISKQEYHSIKDLQVNQLEVYEAYKFDLDTKNKIFNIIILKWFSPSEKILTQYLMHYEEITKKINTYEYELVIDCRPMPNISENYVLRELIQHYYCSNFLKITCILSYSQVALSVVLKRLFFNAGCQNIEIKIE